MTFTRRSRASFPGLAACRVDDVSISPYIPLPSGGVFNDLEADLNAHAHAKIDVTYSPLEMGDVDQELPSGTWATYSQDIGGELVTLPSQSLKWDSDDAIVSDDVNPALFMPSTTHVVTWNAVVDPPWGHISTLRGKTNSAAWRIPSTGQYVYPETLLFLGAKPKITFKLDDLVRTWSLEYQFAEKASKGINADGEGAIYDNAAPVATVYGWNHVWRPNAATPKWDKPVNSTNGDSMFPTGDLQDLFTFQATF